MSMINTEANTMQEVIRRVSVARTTIQEMEDIWKSSAVKELKLRIVRSTALVMVSNECESWIIAKNIKKKVGAFEMWTYRSLLQVS